MSVPHILVVDDEPAIRSITVRVLTAAGYRVAEAVDGRAALSLVASAIEPIDLVVSDIVMPRLNGVELLSHLSVSWPEVPVLLMSGYAAQDLQAQGIAAPCGILSKPFTPDQLLENVERCLALPRQARA